MKWNADKLTLIHKEEEKLTHTYIHSPTAQIHLLWVMIGSPIETTTTTADDDVVVASVGVSDWVVAAKSDRRTKLEMWRNKQKCLTLVIAIKNDIT